MNVAASLSQNSLQGLQVLIVEDETLVAMLIEDYLRELGCEIALSASRVAKAMKSIETCRIDAAVLDVNVAGDSISELVETLKKRGIPFILASGYGARGIGSRWPGSLVLQKPFSEADLGAALLASVRNGARA